MKYNFSFGNTPGIREVLIKNCKGLDTLKFPWNDLDYPEHEGMPELIEHTRDLIQETTGIFYKWILITGGATQSINAYLYAAKKNRSEFIQGVLTNKLYYRYYPFAIKNHDLYHKACDDVMPGEGEVHLIDAPSNPLGQTIPGYKAEYTLWDSCYYSPTYFGLSSPPVPFHEASAGGYNKLTGLNGLRVGWLATQDKRIFDLALQYLEGEVCGISSLSQWSAIHVAKNANFNKFFKDSWSLICANKEEFSKLDHLFGHQSIPEVGMFALMEIDNRLEKLFEKSGVKFTDGKTMGDDRKSVRINLGKTYEETKRMVKEILKQDKTK